VAGSLVSHYVWWTPKFFVKSHECPHGITLSKIASFKLVILELTFLHIEIQYIFEPKPKSKSSQNRNRNFGSSPSLSCCCWTVVVLLCSTFRMHRLLPILPGLFQQMGCPSASNPSPHFINCLIQATRKNTCLSSCPLAGVYILSLSVDLPTFFCYLPFNLWRSLNGPNDFIWTGTCKAVWFI